MCVCVCVCDGDGDGDGDGGVITHRLMKIRCDKSKFQVVAAVSRSMFATVLDDMQHCVPAISDNGSYQLVLGTRDVHCLSQTIR